MVFHKERFRRYSLFIIILISVFFLSGCRFFLSLSGPIPVDYHEHTLTLSWENEHTEIEGTPVATAYFNVFYRDLGTTEWTFLQTTDDSQSSISIRHGSLGDGDYEFAVQAVYNNGKTSALHCSSDFSAWPPGGWYLRWRS